MRSGLVACAIVAAAGCGSPASPGPAPAPLSAGTYTVTMGAASLGCRDLVQPQVVRYIRAWATLSLEGSTWRARPLRAEDGVFEFRIDRDNGPASISAIGVVGTFSGRVTDTGVPPFVPPSGVSMQPEDAAATVRLTGTTSSTGAVVSGFVDMPFVFSNGTRSMTCPAASVDWALIRNPPPQ